MELRHLRYFVALAEELHFGRAADRLGVAQPPLSRQIAQMEAELGTPLFSRTSRRVTLTAAGAAYLERVRRILADVEGAARVALRAADGQAGQLRVGFTSHLAYRFLPELLGAFRGTRTPEVAVEARELSTAQQTKALHDGEIDLGLLTLPVGDESLIIRRLFREPIVLVLPAGHRLARGSADTPVELANLRGEPFVLCPRYHRAGSTQTILDHCRQAGFEPRVTQEIEHKQALVGLIAAGVGLSLLPQSMTGLLHEGVTPRWLTPPLPPLELVAAWRRPEGSADSPLRRRFVETAVKTARAVSQDFVTALAR